MRDLEEMAKQELKDAKAERRIRRKTQNLAPLPKDPNDDKNIILENYRDEAALFAGDNYVPKKAEAQGWRLKSWKLLMNGVGGFHESGCYGFGQSVAILLKYESGAHCVQRVPVTESQGQSSHQLRQFLLCLKSKKWYDIDPKTFRLISTTHLVLVVRTSIRL